MPKFDENTAKLHKKYFNQFLDEMDTEIVNKILSNPFCEEAQQLNRKVEIAINTYIERQSNA